MSPETATLLMFGFLLLLLLAGLHLAFALAVVAVVFGYLMMGTPVFGMFSSRAFGLMHNYVLLAAPLFIFMAYSLQASGLAERLYEGFRLLFGPLRGGLAIATVVVCTLFAASTGIIGASVVAMGLLAVPAMLRHGYSKELATGTTCAAGCLGILIAPSVMLVVYGEQVGISVGRLFLGSILPGLTLSVLYIGYIVIVCLVRPDWGPAMSKEELLQSSLIRRLWRAALGTGPILLLIFAVLGTIFLGIATPTEAAATGAFIALILMFAYGKFSWPTLRDVVLSTLKTTCMVNLVLITASCFTTVFLGMGGGKVIGSGLIGLGLSPMGTLFVMMFVVFILGMFLDWIGILMIIAPIFSPIAVSLGFDPVWFGLLVAVCLQMSFITPPFAYAIFYLKGIAPPEIQIGHIYRGVVPYVILQWIALGLCVRFPQIILVLPNMMID